MTNEQIAAMAAWTLEDFQNDPLGAMAQIRELAAAHLSLQRERDAAVNDMRSAVQTGMTCFFCALGKNSPLDEPCNMCSGRKYWKWRGPQMEQVLASADQSAGKYADSPVLARHRRFDE